MATPENRIVIHDGGDVTLVFSEAPKSPGPAPTPDHAKRDISDSLVEPRVSSTREQTTGSKPTSAESPSRSLVVSSNALRLSSETFRCMLDQRFKEGIELAEKRLRHNPIAGRRRRSHDGNLQNRTSPQRIGPDRDRLVFPLRHRGVVRQIRFRRST